MDDKDRLAGMPPSIGRYQILDMIGVGAMGAVYKAFDPLIKRTLAIKTIRLDIPRASPQYKSFIERFQHEARISGTLSHPNIVTLFDIGEEGGLPFLAMEFVEGQTIASLLESGHRFKPEKVISLVSQIAAAIDYAHTRGVIHRDIKPSNLILSDADRVKVTDFGIAKLADAEMTQSGTLLGTPSYMSPEQAMGDKLDGRSDIFSLGVCAFEMLSGEQPFPGNNVTSILYKLVHVEPVQPANLEMNGLVPQKWHEVFGKVLAKKPDERYQTGAEFVHDLEYCLGSWFGSAMGDEVESTTILDQAALQAMAAGTPMEARGTGARTIPPPPIPPPAPRPAAPPPPPPIDPGEERTIIMKSAPVFDAPAPEIVDVDEDVAAPASDVPTAILSAVPAGEEKTTILPALPGGDDKTVVMGATPPIPKPPLPRPPIPPPAAARPPQSTPVPVPVPVPSGTPAGSGKGLPVGAILGGLFLLGLVAVGVATLLFLRNRAQQGETPATTVVVMPSAAPTSQPLPPGATEGTVRVESDPVGATVTVDGQPRGVTPLDVTALPFGDHEVKLELVGHDTQSQQVSLGPDNARADLRFTMSRSAPGQGTAEITSNPEGAAVAVDGRPVGVTPLRGLTLTAGRHRVSITRDGYEPWSGTFTVQGGRTARVDRFLQPLAVEATPTPRPTAAAVDTARVYENSTGDVDVVAKRIQGSTASYPDRAPRLRSGNEVAVTVAFVVTESGQVEDIEIEESGGAIVDAAVKQAVSNWRYSPAVKRGTNVKVRIKFRQRFRAG